MPGPAPTDSYELVPAEPAFTEYDSRPTISADLAARRRRERLLVVAFAIVAAVVLLAVAILALRGDSKPTVSKGSTAQSQPDASTSTLPTDATTAVPTTAVVPATATAPIATVTPTSLSPAVVPTVIPTVTVVTVPTVTVAPTITTTTPTSTPATAAPTTAVVTTVATTPATPSSTPSPSEGDLGLSIPISRPACDGQFITLIGASVDTPGVAGRVGGLLARFPDAKYLKAELACGSLSPRSADGKALYIVFFGPFATTSDACAARAKGTKDSYVKVLENTAQPSGAVKC